MINTIQLNEFIAEAEKFIYLAQRAKGRLLDEGLSHTQPSMGSEQTAAVRRCSLDLSKCLSRLRKTR